MLLLGRDHVTRQSVRSLHDDELNARQGVCPPRLCRYPNHHLDSPAPARASPGSPASPPMWWSLTVLFSSIFLFTIVLSIPVAFDVGGRDTGLAYSLALFIFYFFYSLISLATPDNSRVRWTISTILRLSQWVIIPSLLIWALGQFAVDAGSSNWVERTLDGVFKSKSTSWREWLFGKDGVLETVMLGSWDNVLRYSGPAFQLLEGFCTLLVIQAAGQLTRWLVNRGRSDTWVVRQTGSLALDDG